MTKDSARLTAIRVGTLLEGMGRELTATFVLVSLLKGDALIFPYSWGTLPPDVAAFIRQEAVPVSQHNLAATLVEMGSAYYSEESYNKEGETPLKTLVLMVGVEPIKTVTGELIGFVNVGREPEVGQWTEEERTRLRQHTADLAASLTLSHVRQRETVSEKRLKGLLHLSSSLSQALIPNDVYETVLQQSIEVLGMRAGGVTIVRPDGKLEIIAARGQPKGVIEAQRVIGLEANHPLADTVREGQALYFPDSETRSLRYPHLVHLFSPETRSSAFVPMLSQGQAIGVLTLSFPEPHTFDEDERGFVEALADVCARA